LWTLARAHMHARSTAACVLTVGLCCRIRALALLASMKICRKCWMLDDCLAMLGVLDEPLWPSIASLLLRCSIEHVAASAMLWRYVAAATSSSSVCVLRGGVASTFAATSPAFASSPPKCIACQG
jgi:hypothetical protein